MPTVSIHPSPATFPLPELISSGIWRAISPAARAALAVIWDFHRRFPDACHPSQATIARLAGLSVPTVKRAIIELSDIGLLTIIPSFATGPNTYNLDWTDIEIPDEESETITNKSPYNPPKKEFQFHLERDEKGREKPFYQKTYHHHKMPDGCVVRSAAEVVIHSYLVDWRVPHWSNLKYSSLGIRNLHPEATVDFLVAPFLLIEAFGQPRMQSQASKYNRNRRKKEEAIKAAGWNLIAIEAGERFTEHHFTPIMDAWAEASMADAKRMVDFVKKEKLWVKGSFSYILTHNLYSDAEDRANGTKPPASPQGFYMDTIIDGMPTSVRTEPRLVLDSQLGKDRLVECIEE